MAGHRKTAAEADLRVAAAKARLLSLADDTRRGSRLVDQASRLVRERPWQGVGLALLAGVALGLAPREVVRRIALLASPVARVLTGLAPTAGAAVAMRGRRAPVAARRAR